MRFNTATSEAKKKIVNLAGGEAHSQSPQLEFVSLLLTSFVKDQFYRTESEQVEQLKRLMAQVSPLFAAKAAIYARKEFGMRTISHLVAGELCKKVSKEHWMKHFLQGVVHRTDDITEITAYYLSTEGKVTNAMRKGFGKVLSGLNEYQLAKYRAEGSKVSLVDCVNLYHPKATPALTKLVKGELRSTETWETKLTQAGQVAETEEEKLELKGKAWKALIAEKKLGYFALLRNLRNIIEQAPEVLPAALEMLVDEQMIKKSLVLPFRFMTAAKELDKISGGLSRKVAIALGKAMDISLSNVPVFDGRTLVVLDTSGSMEGKPIEIGSLFAAALYKSNDADYMRFSDDAQYQQFNPNDSVGSIAGAMFQRMKTGGTDFHQIFKTANQSYDRIIILSDMQGWVGYNTPSADFAEYRKRTKCFPHVFSIDLAGHGSMQFPEQQVYCVAGFSEKIFDVMKLMEQDRNALVNKIEAINFLPQ